MDSEEGDADVSNFSDSDFSDSSLKTLIEKPLVVEADFEQVQVANGEITQLHEVAENHIPNGVNGGAWVAHDDHMVNGHANGHVNGQANGHANGHANGQANGHTHGHVNGHASGHSSDQNQHGTNGFS